MKREQLNIEKEFKKLNDKAFLFFIDEIEKILIKEKLNFSSVGFNIEITDYNGEEIEDTKLLMKFNELIEWYNDLFGNIGYFVFKDGKWISGETRLIKFFKPY
jgi:hypothetical protein